MRAFDSCVWPALARAVVLSGALLGIGQEASAGNLLLNGSFSLGPLGFSSEYEYNPDCWGEGTYFLAGTGRECHALWDTFGDHTTGDGTMMVVNGAWTAELEVWSAELAVQPNTDYAFSAWIATLYPVSFSSLTFSINGISIATDLDAPSTLGVWQAVSATWYSGSSTLATLALVNRNLAWTGNDFALDDLAFFADPQASIVNPEPESIALLAFGLAVALIARRIRPAR